MKRILFALMVLFMAMVGRSEASEKIHWIKDGETLSGLAAKYLGSAKAYQELADFNGIANPDHIYAGHALYIPEHKEEVARVRTPNVSYVIVASTKVTVKVVVTTSVVSAYLMDSPELKATLSFTSVVVVTGSIPSKSYVGSTASLPSSSSSAIISSSSCFSSLVDEVAAAVDIDPTLIRAVMRTESGCNPYALSPKGAMGLMQLMPDTVRLHHIVHPFDPYENIRGGAQNLKNLIRIYGDSDIVLAAYNAGTIAVDKYGGVPPYPETHNFINKVQGWIDIFRRHSE